MKKLRTALILLLALMMSLCLFACGDPNEGDKPGPDTPGPDTPGPDTPGPDTPGPGGDSNYRKIELDPEVITLTDSDEKADIDAALAEVAVIATDWDNEDTELTLSDCNYTNTVTAHEVGEYSMTVTLKSDDSKSATLTVVIDHDFGAETNGVRTCRYSECGARQETKEEDVVIHYGTFHAGIDAALPAGSGWEETSVYTNNTPSGSAIKEFGDVNGRRVPTLTAGQLEPGTTITIRGTAKTTTGDSNAWKHENQYWNLPSIGIADRYNTKTQNNPNAHYQYGVSVIVRQEGWVLYNGIGDTASTTTLGGIMNGYADTTETWRNFGSHPSEPDSKVPGTGSDFSGYVHGVVPTNWNEVKDWWVYSSGDGMNSGDDYITDEEYEYTWNYRTDNVIEMTYKNLTSGKTLKVYVKVPASEVGYYDTIVHGDYNDMTITESVITSKSTPKDNGFKYNGLKSGANSVYAENTAFDASTLDVTVQYEQTGDKWNTLQITNGQVFRYVGEMTRDELAAAEGKEELESTESAKWVSLASNDLEADAIYKIHLSKGGKDFIYLLPADAFTVLPNKVVSAEGADVTVGGKVFKNNGKLGAIAFSVADSKIVLTLADGYVQTIPEELKSAFTDLGTATKYIALRLNAGELGDDFTTEGLTVKNGTANVPALSAIADGDLYLVLAPGAAGSYTISNAQGTDIVLSFASLKGFSLDSKIEGSLKLNKGGTIAATYTLPAGTTKDDLTLEINGGSSNEIGGYIDETVAPNGIVAKDYQGDLGAGILFKEIHLNGTELKLVFEFSGANLANYAPVRLKLNVKGDSIVDTIDYDMEIDDTVKDYISAGEDDYYAFVTASGKLNVIRAFPQADVANGKVSGSFTLNINNGDLESFRKNGLLTVNYSIVDGKLNLVGAPAFVTGYAVVVGTFGDSRDTDKGAYVVFEIDVSGLGITGDYYFNFNNGGAFDPETKPAKILKISGTAVTEETVAAAECEVAIVIEGTCQQQGLYAWAVTKGGKVVFYADAAVAGGEHVDGDSDGTCDLCGSEISATLLTHDENNNKNELKDGEFIEISGRYNDVAHSGVFNGIETNIRQKSGDAFYVRVRNDGYYARETGSDEQITLDYNSTSETHGVELGTCNGVPNGIDGTPIDESSYNAAKKGGYFKVFASYVDGVVTVVTKLWKAEQDLSATPYFQYTVKMTVVSKAASVMVNFRIDTYQNAAGNIETYNTSPVVKGNVSNSTITEVKYAAVGSHAAPTQMTVTNKGNKLVLGGNAPAESGVYYAAFEIAFASAVDANSTVYVRKADGSAYANATATLDNARTKMSVYLPLTADLAPATIDFVNFAGNTMQGDITVDVSAVLLSDVQVTASKSDLALTGDTFDLTYTGNYPATAKIRIGEESVALADLASASAAAPVKVGNSLFSVTKYDAAAKKISFKFDGVADYTKDVAEYSIALTSEDGATLARISVYPNTVSGYTTQLEMSGWYVVAAGDKLILVSDKAAAATLPVIINAGKAASDANAVGVYDLGYNGTKFTDSNIATAAAVLVNVELNDKNVTAIVITVTDLTGLGITATGAYGVMLATDGAAKYYAVAADRQISEQDATQGAEKPFGTHSCTTPGKSGKTNTDESFYWDFSVVPAHDYPASPDENGYFVCTTCGAILKPGSVKNNTVPAAMFATKEGGQALADTGLTVSFWANVGSSDWGAIALKTSNNLIVTLPNLDPWNATGEAKAKFVGYNKFPAGDELIGGSVYSVFLNGASYVTISLSKTGGVTYYKNGVKVIAYAAATTLNLGEDQTAIDPVPTVASFVEEFLKDVVANGLILGSGLSGASNAIVETKTYTDAEAAARYSAYMTEKDYYPEGTPAPTTPVYTDDNEIKKEGGLAIGTLGTYDTPATGWVGYSNTPNWIGKLEKGKKIVISGTQKALAAEPFNSSLTVFAWSGYMPGDRSGNTGVCMNHINGNAGGDEEAWTVARGEPVLEGGADFAALIKEVGKDCTATITFDWTQYNKQFSIVMKVEKDSKSVEVTYTFTEDDGATMLGAYNVGIGVDNSYAVLTSITRTEKAPTQDLPSAEEVTHQHAYVNGLCSTCGGVQPASAVGGTAVADKTWTKDQTFNAALWSMTLKKGGKVAVYGTQEGDVTQNWFSLLASWKVTDNTKSITLRSDNFGFYDDNVWETAGPTHVLDDSNKANGIKSPNGVASALDWATFAGIVKHCDWRVEFDWSGDNVVVTMTFTGSAENTYKGSTVYFAYTLAPGDATTSTIGIGTESAAGAVLCYVATNND